MCLMLGCDEGRPCQRCIRYNKPNCVSRVVKPRGSSSSSSSTRTKKNSQQSQQSQQSQKRARKVSQQKRKCDKSVIRQSLFAFC